MRPSIFVRPVLYLFQFIICFRSDSVRGKNCSEASLSDRIGINLNG